MRKRILFSLILFVLISIVFNHNALSWTEKIHKDLSGYAAESSALSKQKGDYLKNIGFDEGLMEEFEWDVVKTITKWIEAGANLEDKRTSVLPVYGKIGRASCRERV